MGGPAPRSPEGVITKPIYPVPRAHWEQLAAHRGKPEIRDLSWGRRFGVRGGWAGAQRIKTWNMKAAWGFCSHDCFQIRTNRRIIRDAMQERPKVHPVQGRPCQESLGSYCGQKRVLEWTVSRSPVTLPITSAAPARGFAAAWPSLQNYWEWANPRLHQDNVSRRVSSKPATWVWPCRNAVARAPSQSHPFRCSGDGANSSAFSHSPRILKCSQAWQSLDKEEQDENSYWGSLMCKGIGQKYLDS